MGYFFQYYRNITSQVVVGSGFISKIIKLLSKVIHKIHKAEV